MTFNEWYLKKYGITFDEMFFIEGISWHNHFKALSLHMREYVSDMMNEKLS